MVEPLATRPAAGSRPAAAAARPRARPARRSASGTSRRAPRETPAPPPAACRSARRGSAPAAPPPASSPRRCSMPMVPCATAGSISSGSIGVRATASSPSRLSPAIARKVAAATPASSLLSRVSTLPRNSTTPRSGRRCRTCARRRRLEVPTTRARRQRRERAHAGADEGVARILARQAAGDRQPRRLQRRHVLHRVHGDVDPRRPPAPPRSRG